MNGKPMPVRAEHLSDEEILLVLDGEGSAALAKSGHAHLSACETCRFRLEELKATIHDFIALHRSTVELESPEATDASASMRARLAAEQATSSPIAFMARWGQPARAMALACAGVVVIATGVQLWKRQAQPAPTQVVAEVTSTIPDRRLTPGATRPISLSEVCAMTHEEVVRDVPGSLRQQVFREYGIRNPRPEDYEVDYLIAPGLGGTEDIRNLWPEPSTASAWNAGKKDALEEKLHHMVCNGELDLSTAQRAIATDWITAYGKYCSHDSVAGPFLPRRQIRQTLASRLVIRRVTPA